MSEQNETALGLPLGVNTGWPDADDALDDTRLWLRWNPGEVCYVRVLSAEPTWYPGHWVPAVRAYRLCSFPACRFCAAGRAGGAAGRNMASERRLRHLVAVQGVSGSQSVFEFSEAVARQLQALTGFRREGGAVVRDRDLRGLALGLCREGGRQAGNVLAAAAPSGIAWPEFLPEPLDLAELLAASWRRAALHDGKAQPRLPVGF